jgi:hypothetical protein
MNKILVFLMMIMGTASQAAVFQIQCPASKVLTGKFSAPFAKSLDEVVFEVDTIEKRAKTFCSKPKGCMGLSFGDWALTAQYDLDRCHLIANNGKLVHYETFRSAYVFDLGPEDMFSMFATLYLNLSCKTLDFDHEIADPQFSMVLQNSTSGLPPDRDFISKPIEGSQCVLKKIK